MANAPHRHVTDMIRRLDEFHYLEAGALFKLYLERANRGRSAKADGYRASTLGGNGASELTPTEAAANRRAFGKTDDPLQRLVNDGIAELERATTALDRFDFTIALLDRLQADPDDEKIPRCAICATAGIAHPGRRRALVDGAERPACRWAYDRLGSHGVPSEAEIRQHERDGRTRPRAKRPA